MEVLTFLALSDNDRPSGSTILVLEEIAEDYGVFIKVVVQPTQCFDVNACDALLHSVQKRKMRSY